jgi:hypothetical protein
VLAVTAAAAAARLLTLVGALVCALVCDTGRNISSRRRRG